MTCPSASAGILNLEISGIFRRSGIPIEYSLLLSASDMDPARSFAAATAK